MDVHTRTAQLLEEIRALLHRIERQSIKVALVANRFRSVHLIAQSHAVDLRHRPNNGPDGCQYSSFVNFQPHSSCAEALFGFVYYVSSCNGTM